MAKSKWQGQQNGPDWTDVMLTLKAVEKLHGVLVTITLGGNVFDGPGGYTCIAALRVPAEANVLGEPVVALSAEWPCSEHRDLVACVFAGLYELDSVLSKKLWEQNELGLQA